MQPGLQDIDALDPLRVALAFRAGMRRAARIGRLDEGAPDTAMPSETARYRTLFVSDLHLGTRGCQHGLVLDFLRHNDADTIFLVGDIVDGWKLRSGWYWPQGHDDVVRMVLRKVRRGTRVVYVPGNHDEFARDYAGMTFGGVEVARSAVHLTADGRRFLVTHGDEYDVVVRYATWLAYLGDRAYRSALVLNTWLNVIRRRMGLPYWSFSAWAKFKVKNIVGFIGEFESALAQEARRIGADGVICGHIHHPAMRDIGEVTYVNTGDFVESCSFVAEHHDGCLEVLHWRGAKATAASAEADLGEEAAPVAA